MAKKKTKKTKKRSFFGWGMLIYAVVFLTASYFGLKEFWAFMDAYEKSRPMNILNSYMETVTDEYVCDHSQELIDMVDHNIQTEEACRTYIKENLSGGISYARKTKECTDTRQVYVLRSGGKVIGEFAMEVKSEDAYGFTMWELTEESFDLSFLLGNTVSATAPDTYSVSVNGVTLDESYRVGEPVQYEALEGFYEDYKLPTIVSYEAGPFLGDFDIVVTNPDGVTVTEAPDPAVLDDNCSEDEIESLKSYIEKFLKVYVDYMGSSNDQADYNYAVLMNYIVKDSEFAERMYGALYGQRATQSRGDTITEITNNFYFCIDEGYYLCDVTYLVDTIGKQGSVITTNNVRILIVENDGKMLVQSVRNYS